MKSSGGWASKDVDPLRVQRINKLKHIINSQGYMEDLEKERNKLHAKAESKILCQLKDVQKQKRNKMVKNDQFLMQRLQVRLQQELDDH